MFKLKLIIIFITISLASNSNNTDIINFLKDFLRALNQPVKIVCLLCWKKSEKLLLLKILNDCNYQMTVLDLKVNDFVLRKNIDEFQLLLVMDAKCNDHEIILKKANEMNLFRFPYKWLILNLDNIPVYLNIFIDSHVYIANSIEDTFHIDLIYKIHESHRSFVRTNIGMWIESGFFYFKLECFGQDRLDLRGHALTFSVVIVNNETLQHLTDYRDIHLDPSTKLGYVLSTYVSAILNSTTKYITTTTWGYKNKDEEKYPGLMGQLQNKIITLGVSPMMMTKERLDVIDYVSDVSNMRFLFIFRQPPLSYVENVYTLPFDTWVWIVGSLTLFMTILLFYIITNCEGKNLRYRNEKSSQTITMLQSKVPDIVLFEISALCQQGVESEPKSYAGRILTIFNFIFITFLYISYGAFIVALFQSTSNKLNSIEDFLRSNIKLGIENQPYNIYYFTHETEPLRKALYEKKLLSNGQMKNAFDIKEGIRKTREEFFAFHVDTGPGYKIINDIYEENEKCTLQDINIWGFNTNPWVGIAKKTPYKKLLAISYMKLKQCGIQQREYRLFYTQKPKCTHGRNIFKMIELVDCYYVFLVLCVGISIALLLLLAEIMFAKFKTGK